jgi:carnitine-CoA ligase
VNRTIPVLFEEAVEDCPGKVWLYFGDDTFTYEEAHARVTGAAAAMRDRGMGRGSRVLMTARNAADYLFAWLAVGWLGAIAVAINPESSAAELAGLVSQTDPGLILTDRGLADRIPEAPPHGVLEVGELFAAPDRRVTTIAARPDDVAVMIPTSGTTGRSKLVMQTQRAYALAGEGFPYWLELTSEDRLMTSLPLFHVNAPAYSVLGSIAARASVVLLPRFSASRWLEWARHYGATEFNAIGAMLEILMRRPERPNDADNPLRLCYTGPSPTEQRQLAIERRFGFRIVCGYALSESPYGLVWRRGTRPYGTLGSPRQHPSLGAINEARVVRDGRVVDAGEVGELQLRNPAVMRGYYGMPEATREVLVDGWLRTGDLVEVNEDGTYTFVGRAKEVIRRRGENLAPAEVEAALETHPDVIEAAVIGVPSELTEEDVKAFVVLRAGAAVDLEALREWSAQRLAAFKVPRYLEAVDALPHTPTGRIAKHALPRDRTPEEHDLESLAPERAGSRGKT